MADPQGPGPGALDPHPYFHVPPSSSSKPYQNGVSDLTNVILKNPQIQPWLPPTSTEEHPRLSDTFSEMRYLELNNWDLNYSEGLTARLVDTRSLDSADTPINYRPWEKPDSSTTPVPQPPSTPTPTPTTVKHENGVSSTNSPENKSPPTLTPLQNAFPTFTDAFQPPQKLPSFQSQFNAFTDPPAEAPPPSLPSFHTLPANRYVTPPAPHHHHHPNIQHAMVPTQIHREPQPFLDDRHVLFPGQVPHPVPQFPTIIATTQNGQIPPPTYHVQMNGQYALPSSSANPQLQLQELVPVPPMHTLLHAHPIPRTESIPSLNINLIDNAHFQNSNPQPPPPPPTFRHEQQTHVIAVKLQPYEPPKQNGHVNGNGPTPPTPQTPSTPKQKKRKREHNGTNGHEPAHQVSSVSSTEPGYKRPSIGLNGMSKTVNGNGITNGHDLNDSLDKPVKKKRKRCGECIGCQRKDNCGECAPCRNDKSHQICKQRRCDKLTEKKTPKSKMKTQQLQNQQQTPQQQHNQQHHHHNQ